MHRSQRVVRLCLMACLLVACGGGGNGSHSSAVIPADATAAHARMQTLMAQFVPHLAGAHSGLLLIMNPDAGLTPGVVFAPDTQPGAPANSYTFGGIYDGNDDAVTETSLSGQLTFAGDPTSLAWSPLAGTATVDVDIPVIGHVYHAALAFTATAAELRLSGSGSFTNPATGETIAIDIPAAAAIVVRAATAGSGVVANACGYSVDGSVPVELSGSSGTLSATWLFSPNTASVAVQGVSFRDPAGQSTALPDSSVTLPCGGNGTINDWVATYDQGWVCLPFEHGRARLTLTASGASTVSITDEDPPGSGDTKTFSATTIGASPHALQGYFDGGPVGGRYREHFTWTLGKTGDFSQLSRYTYSEGPQAGAGGICAATAKRVP